MAILAIQVILVVALTGQLVYGQDGQDCSEVRLAQLGAQLDPACQNPLLVLRAFQVRAQAEIVATGRVNVTADVGDALTAACVDSCIGSFVDTLRDECSQAQADDLGSVCSRRPTDNSFCIEVSDYVLSRVNEAVAACNNVTCPAGCSNLLPVLQRNGDCCVVTRLPFVPVYDEIIMDYVDYYDVCDMTISACENPYFGAGATVFIAKTLLTMSIFIATFLNIV